MAKLVILNQGMIGRTFDLIAERTTVGRVEDNTFQIADPSISSRHAEIFLRGAEIVIKDSNSTNGSFIDGEKITEAVFKPGQVLRFGQVEIKIDDGKPLAATIPAPPPAAVSSKQAKENTMAPRENTMVIPRGVSWNSKLMMASPPVSLPPPPLLPEHPARLPLPRLPKRPAKGP